MGSGHLGWAGEPAVFHVEAGPDRGHASVPAPPLSTVAGSVKATTCTLTSVTATPAPVSHINFYLLLLVRLYFYFTGKKHISSISVSVYLSVKMSFTFWLCFFQSAVTGVHGIAGAAAARHVMEVRWGATGHVTTPDLPMVGEHVQVQIHRYRDAAQPTVLVSPHV